MKRKCNALQIVSMLTVYVGRGDWLKTSNGGTGVARNFDWGGPKWKKLWRLFGDVNWLT